MSLLRARQRRGIGGAPPPTPSNRLPIEGWSSNLTTPSYYGGVYPFINLCRSGGGFYSETGGVTFDAVTGHIASLPNGASANLNVILDLDDQFGYFPPGTYIATTASGAYCEVSFPAGSTGVSGISQGTNSGSPTAQFTQADLGSDPYDIWLRVHVKNNTGSTINNITDLYVGKSSLKASHDAGEIFDPIYLADLAGVKCLKFSDWTGMNSSDFGPNITQYSQLPTEANMRWSPVVPYSVCAKLCKAVGAVHWFNVPLCYDTFSFDAAVAGNLFTTHAQADNSVCPHNLSVNDRIIFWGYNMRDAPHPSSFEAATIYYVKTVPSASTFTASATLGGATKTVNENWTSAGYGNAREVTKLYDPATLWDPIVAAIYAADPDATVAAHCGLEKWNSSVPYSLNVMQQIFSAPAGSRLNAAAGAAYWQAKLFKSVEAVFARDMCYRLGDGQTANFGAMGGSYTYTIPTGEGLPGEGQQWMDIIDGDAIAPYVNPSPDGTATDWYPAHVVANGGATWSNATWDSYWTLGVTRWASLVASYVASAHALKPGLPIYTYEAGQQFAQFQGLPGFAAATVSIGSPCVVSRSDIDPDTGLVYPHGTIAGLPVKFATTGALPTGLPSGVSVFVKTVLDARTFTVCATQGGAAINTSGSQSGTHSYTWVTSEYPAMYVNWFTYLQSANFGAVITDYIQRAFKDNGLQNYNQYKDAGWSYNATFGQMYAWGFKRAHGFADNAYSAAVKAADLP